MTPNFKSNRILVIDDNRSSHPDIKKILSSEGIDAQESTRTALFGAAPGAPRARAFTIDSAHQGEQGLARVEAALAERQPYALAFVDVQMPPGWDGIETIARLWKVDPHLQVVVGTAFSDYSWDEIIEKLGASDRLVILKKPFDNIEVVQLAHALTARWQLAQQVRAHIGDLERTVATRTAELHKSEAHFRVIAENIADLIAVVDERGAHTYHSPSFEKVLGLSPTELSQMPAAAHIHPEDQLKVLLATQGVFETGVGRTLEYRMKHRDGSWRALEAHANPVRNDLGMTEHLVMVARDITLRRQMEVRLQHAQKMESIGQLAAGIAHEINTPTQYIGDNSQFVQDSFRDLTAYLAEQSRLLLAAAREGRISPELVAEIAAAALAADLEYVLTEIPRAIEQSLEGVHRIAKIVGAMKEFSHPGSGEKTTIDLNRAIESTLTVAGNEWKHVADLVTDFEPALPLVRCFPGEFNQVILNLVVNASHAIADALAAGRGGRGRITVTTRADGDWAEVRVADTGTGIPEEIRRKIFDPFFTTKGVGKGTGQGLAIAHSVVVDKHGGELRLESAVGQGTTFIIRLPLRLPAADGRTE